MIQELAKNNINRFGNRAKQWLNNLPQTIKILKEEWQLTNIQPVENITWNYVAKAISKIHGLVVLKISCDEKLNSDEVKALKHFNNYGIVKLIAHNAQYHAMLLYQAQLGESLFSINYNQIHVIIKNYSDIVLQLASATQHNYSNFNHISHWLKAFYKIDKHKLPHGLIDKAIYLKNKLLASRSKEFILHGDLHNDNIISDNNKWVAIDPKGIIGEVEFEVACFNFIKETEIKNKLDIPQLFQERSELIAKELNLNHQKLKDWVLVRTVLNACWTINDNEKVNTFLNHIKQIFPDIIT